ncbi:MAG: SulP family inorganic anion transporter [Myxococcales bacterium]|nr:SulP family inorganic anion transporter [Myxococcales bacterium]
MQGWMEQVLGARVSSWGDVSRALLPALVVFLVALPLSLGVALASGVPPAAGLISAIVGGIVVGRLAGSPLQVSGPAAGLAVIIYDLVQTWGLASLGIIVVLAGAMQAIAGGLKLGRWFRAVSPAVIRGMLAGIGLVILGSQLLVLFGASPTGTGLGDWGALPGAVATSLTGGAAMASAVVGIVAVLGIVGWERIRPGALRAIPGALVGVVAASALALLSGLPVPFVELPTDLIATIDFTTPSELLAGMGSVGLWGAAAALAAVASAEAMLSATAVDQLHDGERTEYDRELVAQGVGNIVAGALGALPVTGVIVRSSANVQAGAENRLPTMIHGVALLVLVLAAPALLQAIPLAALAAVLVVTGVRLLAWRNVVALWRFDRAEAAILVTTALAIVTTDLLTGVVAGFVLAGARLLWRTMQLDLHVHRDDAARSVTLTMMGAATFVSVPTLAEALEAVPDGYHVAVDHEALQHVDHSVVELLKGWQSSRKGRGNTLGVSWPGLMERYVAPDAPGVSRMVG